MSQNIYDCTAPAVEWRMLCTTGRSSSHSWWSQTLVGMMHGLSMPASGRTYKYIYTVNIKYEFFNKIEISVREWVVWQMWLWHSCGFCVSVFGVYYVYFIYTYYMCNVHWSVWSQNEFSLNNAKRMWETITSTNKKKKIVVFTIFWSNW